MFDHPLSFPARLAVTLTSLVFVIFAHRIIFRGSRRAGLVLGGAWLVAAAFAHVPPLTDTLPRTFAFGFPIALGTAVASLFSPSLRRAFDAIGDSDMRVLLSFRAIYGAFLFALAMLGHFPQSFALTAGLGDLVVGWLAIAMPTRLSADGPRWARALVHGVGMADMLMVLFVAVTLVRPWSLAHGNATTGMTLPWLAVPLMFAINAHGLRKVAGLGASQVQDPPSADDKAAFSQAVGDGSESPRGVRRALP